jgi:hypothetical protein
VKQKFARNDTWPSDAAGGICSPCPSEEPTGQPVMSVSGAPSRPAPPPLEHLRAARSPGSPALKIKFALENNAEHLNQVLARLGLTSS